MGISGSVLQSYHRMDDALRVNRYLDFEKPDYDRFPMLALAYEALKGGLLLPVVYNAANEIAVEAFLKGRITFLEIPALTGYVINHYRFRLNEGGTIDKILDLDREARELAVGYVKIQKADNRESMGDTNDVI